MAHARLEKVNFELARLKRWRFGVKTEAMTARQRALLQDSLAEDKASLQAQLAKCRAVCPRHPRPRKPQRVGHAARRRPSTWNVSSIATNPRTRLARTLSAANNLIERQIKPWKLCAKNWLFVGSELAGQRAAVVMSLVQSAKLNRLDPWAYLLARIHSHPSQRLDELLPHRWRPG